MAWCVRWERDIVELSDAMLAGKLRYQIENGLLSGHGVEVPTSLNEVDSVLGCLSQNKDVDRGQE